MISRIMASLCVLIILNIVLIVTGKEFSDAEINSFLKKLNKPALKSIKSPDGDTIDCVHMNNHPIYDHPLFKNHTIQMRPSSYPKGLKFTTTEKHNMMAQLWTTKGKCPKNSIPIIRTTRKNILQAESIERFGKKNPNSIPRQKPTNEPSLVKHEYAVVSVNSSQPQFYGARAYLNVWKPYVQMRREFSLAQIWLVAGDSNTLNAIEAGWQVYRRMYGDYNPRFFIFWTADGYNRTGCYNLMCSGFVQTNQEFAIGGAFPECSLYDRGQTGFDLTIWKDSYTGNWWLMVGMHHIFGYWPATLFSHLQHSGGTMIDWGGEITNYRNGSQHTTTQMGSGHFGDEGYKKASFFKGLLTFDEHGHAREPVGLTAYMTNSHCYNVRFGQRSPTWGHSFFYGGPGRNRTSTCE